VGLDLAHGGDVSLRDLVVVLHVVLERLVVVVDHLLARHRPHFPELVRLVVCLRHRNLILGVERQLGVRTFELGHEW
jgi:hypothetical protein